MIKDIFLMSLQQLKKRPMRTILTAFQVMIGIATIAIIFNIVIGLQDGINQMEEVMGSGLYQMQVGQEIDGRDGQSRMGTMSVLTAADIERLRSNVDTIEHISPVESSWDSLVRSDNIFYRVNRIGYVGHDYDRLLDLNIVSGNFFTERDYNEASKVAVISRDAAAHFFVGENPIGHKIDIYRYWRHGELPDPVSYTVIGVFEEHEFSELIPPNIGGFQVLVPASGFGAPGVGEQPFNNFLLEIKRGDYEVTRASLSALIQDKHEGQDAILRAADEMGMMGFDTGIRMIYSVMIGFGLLIVVISSIGILSTLMVNILERTKQIGLEKALGAGKSVIFMKITSESLFISLIGAVLGLMLAYLLSYYLVGLFEMFPVGLKAGFYPLTVLLSLFVALFAGCIFGIYPALQAANLDPVEALQQK